MRGRPRSSPTRGPASARRRRRSPSGSPDERLVRSEQRRRAARRGRRPRRRARQTGAALAAAPPEDRTQCLLNLAQVVNLTGERQHAVDLLTKALAMVEGPSAGDGRRARADILPWLDRWDEAWQDVEAALVNTEPAQEVALRHNRVGLLMMAGRLVEAEQEAAETVALAARHAPGYMSNLYASLALLATRPGTSSGRRPTGCSAKPRPGAARAAVAAVHGTQRRGRGPRVVGRPNGRRRRVRSRVPRDRGLGRRRSPGVPGGGRGQPRRRRRGRSRGGQWNTEAITAARSALELVGDTTAPRRHS